MTERLGSEQNLLAVSRSTKQGVSLVAGGGTIWGLAPPSHRGGRMACCSQIRVRRGPGCETSLVSNLWLGHAAGLSWVEEEAAGRSLRVSRKLGSVEEPQRRLHRCSTHQKLLLLQRNNRQSFLPACRPRQVPTSQSQSSKSSTQQSQ